MECYKRSLWSHAGLFYNSSVMVDESIILSPKECPRFEAMFQVEPSARAKSHNPFILLPVLLFGLYLEHRHTEFRGKCKGYTVSHASR